MAVIWRLWERSGRFINQPATLNGFPNEVKSLQGLILYHLQGATCSTAIIGMDGTATIGREGKGGSKGEGVREGERDDWVGVREKERKRGGKLEGGQRIEMWGCQTHANDDTQCVATSQRGRK